MAKQKNEIIEKLTPVMTHKQIAESFTKIAQLLERIKDDLALLLTDSEINKRNILTAINNQKILAAKIELSAGLLGMFRMWRLKRKERKAKEAARIAAEQKITSPGQ